MSWLLVVQPDADQYDILRDVLQAHISDAIVVAESLDAALSAIDHGLPDVILVPTLIPAVEDSLVAYLGARPGAAHVQILGIPRLERAGTGEGPDRETSLQQQLRAMLAWPWRRHREPRVLIPPGCDPVLFLRDVIAYLAAARDLKEEFERNREWVAMSGQLERRRQPRFANDEVPWISEVRFGRERAALINVSSRGALLNTHTRPDPHFLRRSDPNVRERPRLIFELASHRQVHAVGRVIRCVPLTTKGGTHYEVVFSFDDAVGLELPVSGALPPGATESQSAVLALPAAIDVDNVLDAHDWRSRALMAPIRRDAPKRRSHPNNPRRRG